jgi:hypothetical protein
MNPSPVHPLSDPWLRRFAGRSYEVHLEEEAAVHLAGLPRTSLLFKAVLKRLEMLKTFPPDEGYWTPPLISFEAGSAHHALVTADHMAVEITAHYRLDGRCIVVRLEPREGA